MLTPSTKDVKHQILQCMGGMGRPGRARERPEGEGCFLSDLDTAPPPQPAVTVFPWWSLPMQQSSAPLSEKLWMWKRQSVSPGLAPPTSEDPYPPEGADSVDRAPKQGQAAPGLEVPETQHAGGSCLG